MKEIQQKLTHFLNKSKEKIVKFVSEIVKIKSYSSNEEKVVKFILEYISNQKLSKNSKVKKIKNNIILFYNFKNSSKIKILYDAHTDTVPAEDSTNWNYSPFSGKYIDDKVYGRGSCDDKGSVASLVFCFLFLNELQIKTSPLAFSLSSNEENSSGKGIEEVLKYVKPEYCIICEPSDLKIIYGHKGKWSVKIKFYGKSAHSSAPHLGKNAIYSVYPIMKNIIENKNKNFIKSALGNPTYTITYIESKTNSLNSIPHECSIYIDYRSVLGETEKSVKNFLLRNVKDKNYDFVPQHRFFKAWILDEKHNLLRVALQTYKICFNKETKPLLWQFCTNGSITMAEHKIPTVGFGPGSPFLAHQDNEYIKVSDVLQAIKFYTLLAVNNDF